MAGIQVLRSAVLARPASGAWIVLISAAIFGVIAGAVLFVVFIVLTFIARDRLPHGLAGRRQTELLGFFGWRDPALLGRVWIPLCLTVIQSARRIWAFPPRIASFSRAAGTGRKTCGSARCPRRGLHERARGAARRASGRKSSVGARGAPCAALQFPCRPLFLPSRPRVSARHLRTSSRATSGGGLVVALGGPFRDLPSRRLTGQAPPRTARCSRNAPGAHPGLSSSSGGRIVAAPRRAGISRHEIASCPALARR